MFQQLASGRCILTYDLIRNNGIARLASLASRGDTCDRALGLSQEVVAHVPGEIDLKPIASR